MQIIHFENNCILGVDLNKDILTEPVSYGGFILFNNLTPHRSLPNNSNDIRWSVDLRWQSPRHPYGFYNIQDGILFRSADQPNIRPDWKSFFAIDRKLVWQQKFSKKEKLENDEFDTRVTGPWIGQWEVVNQNDHTDLFQQITS
ncbi:hypothetical protein Btru_076372 [Bulinus truncatus]|nr:hypothetical protein Btru_076372 [Bulinus truncatus]